MGHSFLINFADQHAFKSAGKPLLSAWISFKESLPAGLDQKEVNHLCGYYATAHARAGLCQSLKVVGVK